MAWPFAVQEQTGSRSSERNKHMQKQLCERLVHQRRSSFNFEMKSDVEIVLGGPELASQSSFLCAKLINNLQTHNDRLEVQLLTCSVRLLRTIAKRDVI